MQILESARSLAEYINTLDKFTLLNHQKEKPYEHIGALYTNIILQAGLNYKSVVQPRVIRVAEKFPEAESIRGLIGLIKKIGTKEILKWQHHQKLKRFSDLIEFSLDNNINTCRDLKLFLTSEKNREAFISVKGLGLKTLDYTMKLLSFDTIAVDRHIIGFMESAGINHANYSTTKKTVEFAADLLNVTRSSLDATIWYYMSEKQKIIKPNKNQLRLSF